jgi:hypothetical protein
MYDLPGQAGPVPHLAVLVGEFVKPECLEQDGPKMSRHKSGEILQLRTDTGNQGKQKMVAGREESNRIHCKELRKVAEIYDWIDQQLDSAGDLSGRCDACGRCCDFDAYDHRLYVTGPELMYLAAGLNAEKFRPMLASRCPYNIDGKCSVYEYRFAGCRVFCCKGDAEFQSSLTEAVLKKLKSLCTELEIPYLYRDLVSALNGPSAG